MRVAKTKVLNLLDLPKRIDNGVYIGRGSKWGNPFVIGKHGDRKQVLELYRRHLWNSKDLLAALPELHGKSLICFCHPAGCHGDVLVAAVNWKMAAAKTEAAALRAAAAAKQASPDQAASDAAQSPAF